MSATIVFRTLVFMGLGFFVPLAGFAATMPAVQMKVVDAPSGLAAADVHVLFQANAWEGTFTGHGGRTANLFIAELVTDQSGDIRFPERKFSAQPFFLNTNYENPKMVLFKPGYQTAYLTNNLRIIPKLKEVTVWEYNQQTIKLKPATTAGETARALDAAALYAETPMGSKNLCTWREYPRFLVALDRAIAAWKSVPRQNAEFSTFRLDASPLQKILGNEEFFAGPCGSPKAFFAPYLN